MFFARSSSRTARPPFRPVLESLEERLVPATQTFDPGDVSGLVTALQAAAAAPADTTVINLLPGATYTLTAVDNYWYGPNGLPAIQSNVVIHGNGAVIARDTSDDDTPDFRLFYVSGGLELTPGSLMMDNVTLEGGEADGGTSRSGGGGLGAGGAIFNQGTLNLTDVTLTHNDVEGGETGEALGGAGGGGIGSNALSDDGGGFGGSLGGTFGGSGGNAGLGGGGGGGGFVMGANGADGTVGGDHVGGGIGGFGAGGGDGGIGGRNLAGASNGGAGGAFGVGGSAATGGGGGGGVGGGGGGGSGDENGGGGFGGGGAAGNTGAAGGFGGGGGASNSLGGLGGAGGFGAGNGAGGGGAAAGGGGAALGAAIFNMGADSAHPGSGQATLTNCTLVGNFAVGGGVSPVEAGDGGSGLGGALFNLDGKVILDNDTLAFNQVDGGSGGSSGADGASGGGAVYNLAFGNDIDTGGPVTATVVLNNCILAKSEDGNDFVIAAINGNGTNIAAVSGSHNLVMSYAGPPIPGVISLTSNPQLGPPHNNGGLTPTLLPAGGSPVLGAGDPGLAPDTDQRGVPRPPGGPTDLGSVQVSVALAPPPAPPPSPPPPSSPPPSSPLAPSLIGAIIGLYIAEVEKDIGFGDATAEQQTIDFDSQYTIFAGINLAPFIEMIADANVRAARGGM